LHSAPATAQDLFSGIASRTTVLATLSHRRCHVGGTCLGASQMT
jgi:hypothetical protein